jgi:peptidoglycan/LPS O-acetylase OafA/YrhL
LGNRITSLDGLRGVAALLVFALHAGFIRGGFIGVDLFFVLSGFVITRLIRGEIDAGTFDLREFYKRRFKRLVPALLPVLLFVFACKPADWLTEDIPSLFAFSNWTYGFYKFPHLLPHTWTLSVEWQFYLIWPFILLIVAKAAKSYPERTALALCFAVIIVACWRSYLVHLGAGHQRIYAGTDVHCDGLLLGCALAFAGERAARITGYAWPLGVFYSLRFSPNGS